MMLWILTLFSLVGAQASFAQTQLRNSESTFNKEYTRNPSSFQNAPVYHFVPSDDWATLALQFDLAEVQISDQSETLNLKGRGVSPYVAFSFGQFGIGFSGEFGRHSSSFTEGVSSEEGNLEYQGLGMHFSVMPFPKISNRIVPTLLLGVRNFDAHHHTTATGYGLHSDAAENTYEYSVRRYQSGINVGLKFFKSFYVVPWLEHTMTDTQAIEERAKEANDQRLYGDVVAFWQTVPSLRYGLDFVIKIAQFDFHLGNAVAVATALQREANQISSHVVSLGMSYHFRSENYGNR